MKQHAAKLMAVAIAVATSTQLQASTLLESVNEALATNPDILLRVSEARARADEITQARSGYLPRVDMSAGIGYEQSRNSTTVSNAPNNDGRKYADKTRREASLTATQMLFDGFATKSEVERQEARKLSADMDLCTAAERTALNVTEAYVNVLRNQALVQTAKANQMQHQEVVELIRKKGESGMSSDADIAQAEGRLVLAEANTISAEAALRDAQAAYHRVVGRVPGSVETPVAPEGMPASLEDALGLAVNHHPVLKVAAADVSAAEASYEASKSNYLPEFNLELGATWGKDQNGGSTTTYDHTAMVRMNYNLFNGGADKARRSQTSNLMNEALEIKNRAQRQVEEEVRLAWVAARYGADRLEPLAGHVKHAKKSRDLYERQFQLGTRTLLDLLDSQREYYNAINAYVDGQNNLIFSQYRLMHSTGSLLSSMQADMPVGCSG
ncbi:TolC family outer membrane protein [Spongorhabdus nitratireducens]